MIGRANQRKVWVFFNSLSAVKSGTADKWPKCLMSLESIVFIYVQWLDETKACDGKCWCYCAYCVNSCHNLKVKSGANSISVATYGKQKHYVMDHVQLYVSAVEICCTYKRRHAFDGATNRILFWQHSLHSKMFPNVYVLLLNCLVNGPHWMQRLSIIPKLTRAEKPGLL